MDCIRRLLGIVACAAGLTLAGGLGAATAQAQAQALSPAARARGPEAEALRAEIRDLRRRLQRQGLAEAERREGRWWDLPGRRQQQFRLRRLSHWRDRLEDAQFRLMQLERDAGAVTPAAGTTPTPTPTPALPEKPLKDKEE